MKDIRIWGNFYGFIVQGMIVTSFGAVMPELRRSFGLSYAQGGALLAALAAGNLIFSFLSGMLSERMGLKRVILLGTCAYIAGLLLILASRTALSLYAGAFITGIGWGTCNTSINMMINSIVKGDGKTLNLLHMTYGIGAFLVPFLAASFFRVGWNCKNIFLLLIFLAAAAAGIVVRMPEAPAQKAQPVPDVGGQPVFHSPELYVFMLMAFFYEGVENTLSGWLVTYLASKGQSETFAQNMLSVFWISIIVGRCLNGFISRKVGKAFLILLLSAGSLSAVLFFVYAGPALTAGAVVLIGLMLSGIYPLTIACAHSVMSESGTAGAMITSTGGFGATAVPFASGQAAEAVGTSGMILSVIFATCLLIAVSAWNLHRVHCVVKLKKD